MKISFDKPVAPEKGAYVVTALDGAKLAPATKDLDDTLGGAIGRAAKAARFKGSAGETLELIAPGDGSYSRVLLLGLGKPDDLDAGKAEAAGGKLAARLLNSGESEVKLHLDAVDNGPLGAGDLACAIATGAALRSWRFDKYRTTEKAEDKPTLKALTVLTEGATAAKKAWKTAQAQIDGNFFTRELVSEPANVLFPKEFAKRCKALEKLGVTVEVLSTKDLEKLGMGALLGVAQGSVHEPYVVVMSWAGKSGGSAAAAKGKKGKSAKGNAAALKDPVCFIGKGVCFDTGGISLKPAAGMEDMKWDMGGAGVVAGLMHSLAARKAKCDVVGLIGLVENMPDGKAQRPGDVVTSMSGQTIEVINTDAEGRLVLCDVMTYAQQRFKPKLMIDLATLTGAIIITFGHEYAGLFSNDDQLAERIASAAKKTGEKVWRQPMGEEFDKMLKSDCADMKNVGSRSAGSITAAQFLQRFVKDTPWAHIDIAGAVWRPEARALHDKGATGFGVRLLDRFVSEYYER